PHLNNEADVDSFVNSLESVLVSAAQASTPQTINAQSNQKKTNLQIEQLVLEKRRLRREWQFHRSPSAKQSLRLASRELTKALQQEEAYVQSHYIEQLCTSSTKNSLWRAHPTLSSPKETVMPIRNPTGGWERSDADRASTFANHLKNVFQQNPEFTLPTIPYEPQLQHETIEF
ncbi:hypothetical protein KR215_010210, partial [Drosophila sulfurigaster]